MDQGVITLILLAVLFVSVIGLFFIARWIYKSSPFSKKSERISRLLPSADQEKKAIKLPNEQKKTKNLILDAFREWINDYLSNLSSEKLQIKISSAYWPITDTEFILLRIISVVLAFFLGWLIPANLLGGIFLALLSFLLAPFLLDRAISKRQQKFANQLLDVLILIKGAVQAGYGLMQALDLAVKEIPAPASEEFSRVLREVRYGISLEGALTNLSKRMENDELQIVVTAIIINTQVGGNLSTVLESTIATIRDRLRLMSEIRSLTSYARFVGVVLTLLPLMIGIIIFILSPEYYETVKTSLIVQILFAFAIIGIIIGNVWIRRMVRIKV